MWLSACKMQNSFLVSFVLIFLIHASNGGVLDAVHGWFSQHFHSQPVTREILPDTGYWNYMTILGLTGRVLHFFVTDTDAFGNEIKELGVTLSNEIGDDKFLNLEREVAETFPLFSVLQEIGDLLGRVSDVQDPTTQRTLGDATEILTNLANDRQVVKEFVKRWNMVEHLDTVFKHNLKFKPTRSRLQKTKEFLLENRPAFTNLLADPEVMNRLSEELIQSLHDVSWYKTTNLLEQIIIRVRINYPEEYRQVMEDLLDVKDGDTDISILDCLIAISNILTGPLFREKLREYVRMEPPSKSQKETEEALQLLLEGDVLSQPAPPSEQPTEKLIDASTPETVRADLTHIDIVVSTKTAERLLQKARAGTLIKEFLQKLSEAETTYGKVTPEIVDEILRKEAVTVQLSKIEETMQLLLILPPEIIKGQLDHVGIPATIDEIVSLQKKIRECKPSAEAAEAADEADEADEAEPVEVIGATDATEETEAPDSGVL